MAFYFDLSEDESIDDESKKIYLDINCAPILPLLFTVPPDRHVEVVWQEMISSEKGEDFYRHLFCAMSPGHSLGHYNTKDVESFWMFILGVEGNHGTFFQSYDYFFTSLKDANHTSFLELITKYNTKNGFYIFVNESDTKQMWFCEKSDDFFNFNFYDEDVEQEIKRIFSVPEGKKANYFLGEDSVFYEIIEHVCDNKILNKINANTEFFTSEKLKKITFYDNAEDREKNIGYDTSFFMMSVEDFNSRDKLAKFSDRNKANLETDNITVFEKNNILKWNNEAAMKIAEKIASSQDEVLEKKKHLNFLRMYLTCTNRNLSKDPDEIQPTNSFFFRTLQSKLEKIFLGDPRSFFMFADFVFFVAPRMNFLRGREKHKQFFNFLENLMHANLTSGKILLPAFERTEATLKTFYETLEDSVLKDASKTETYSGDVKFLVQVMITSSSSSQFMMWSLQLFNKP